MKTISKVLISGILIGFSSTLAAQVTASAGYSQFSEGRVDLGAVQGTVGYRIPLDGIAGRSYIIPEARLGVGVDDDTIRGVTVEMDEYYGATARFQYESRGGFYAFAYPSYTRFSLSGSFAGFAVSDDSWEFGAGAGVGFVFTDFLGAEIAYERIDDADVFNASIRFGF